MYDLDEIAASPALRERLRRTIDDPEGRLAWPRSAKIKLTARCNFRCVMCKYWRAPRGDELSTDDARRILAQLAEIGCRKVHFSGGEVLLRSDFLDLVEHAARLGLRVNFTTNGSLIDKTLARRLGRLRVNSVAVSLDAADAKTHDRIRGVPGAFKAAVRGAALVARYARKGRPKLRINTVLTRRNYHTLPDILRLARELGAVEVHPMPVDAKGQDALRLSKAHLRDYKAHVAPAALALREQFGFSTGRGFVYPFGRAKHEMNLAKEGLYALGYYDEHRCYAPWLHTFIEWSGAVYLCCMARGRTEPLGDARRAALADILAGDAYARARRQLRVRRLDICARCDNFLAENRAIERLVQTP